MFRQIKYAAVISVISSVMLLAGCGEDQNEAEFRRQLIEKALNDDVKKEGVAFLAENRQQPGDSGNGGRACSTWLYSLAAAISPGYRTV